MSPVGPLQIVIIAVAGAVVGAMSGALGLGGGFLIFPLLTVGLGLPSEIAVGCASCQALGPATTALLVRGARWRDFDIPLVMLGGLAIGVWSGAMVLHALTQGIDEADAWVPEAVTTGLYALMLSTVGGFSLFEARRAERYRPLSTGWLKDVPLPPEFNSLTDGLHGSLPLLAWFGLLVGFQSGLLGNSGGLLLMPGMVYLFGFPTQRAVAYSLAIVWLISLKGTAVHAWYGHVDLWIVAALLLGGTVGAQLGSEWGRGLRGASVRMLFGWLAVATSLVMVWKFAVVCSSH
ncbi:MAG: sulfite exporter TauE/SafE family protein [Planctomycetaceae bacterium]